MTEGDATFPVEEIQKLATDIIGSVLGSSVYNQSEVSKWSSSIVSTTINKLTSRYKGYKFIVTCVLMQKTGAGLNTAASCYWDSSTDGSCLTRWENKTITAIVQVFGVAI